MPLDTALESGGKRLGGTHAYCFRSFGIRKRLNVAELNTNNQSTLASPGSFTFFSGSISLSHPNGFSTSQRLLRLIAYPGWRVARLSIALRRCAVFYQTCGMIRNALSVETKSFVS